MLVFILLVVALIVLVVIAERHAKPRAVGTRPHGSTDSSIYYAGDAGIGIGAHAADSSGGGGDG